MVNGGASQAVMADMARNQVSASARSRSHGQRGRVAGSHGGHGTEPSQRQRQVPVPWSTGARRRQSWRTWHGTKSAPAPGPGPMVNGGASQAVMADMARNQVSASARSRSHGQRG